MLVAFVSNISAIKAYPANYMSSGGNGVDHWRWAWYFSRKDLYRENTARDCYSLLDYSRIDCDYFPEYLIRD